MRPPNRDSGRSRLRFRPIRRSAALQIPLLESAAKASGSQNPVNADRRLRARDARPGQTVRACLTNSKPRRRLGETSPKAKFSRIEPQNLPVRYRLATIPPLPFRLDALVRRRRGRGEGRGEGSLVALLVHGEALACLAWREQPRQQPRVTILSSVVSHSHRQRLFLANDYDQPFASRDRGVHKIALEQKVMLRR